MKFRYLVTVTVPDGGGDDGPEDWELIGRVLDQAAEEMDRPMGSKIETRPLPPMSCTLCGGDGLSISDPCFSCSRGLEASARAKRASWWLTPIWPLRNWGPAHVLGILINAAFWISIGFILRGYR